ncbi:MAG: HutD family protein [Caldilineaceae bacterium]|nr:HutD family protein [Caldilineaceae bacterium]
MSVFAIAGTVIPRTEQPPSIWLGGTTRTIYTYPPSANGNIRAAQLYVGTATIERDGPYSVFTDRTRIHLPMRGNGLHLHFKEPSETVQLPSFAQATFPGDRPLTVTLVDGTVEAFNLIFAANVTATLDSFTVEPGAELMLSGQTSTLRVLYLVEGSCSIRQEAGAQNSPASVTGEAAQLAESDAYIGNGEVPLRVGAGNRVSRLIVTVAKIL